MRRKKNKSSGLTPLPEAITGEKWRVLEGPPAVDLDSRTMLVPTSSSDRDFSARAHEMVHVRITPPKSLRDLAREAQATLEAVNVVEDMRVHTFMLERSVPRSPITTEEQKIQWIIDNKDNPRAVAAMLLAADNTPDYRGFSKLVTDLLPNAYEILTCVAKIRRFGQKIRQEMTECEKFDPMFVPDGFYRWTAPVAQLFDHIFSDSNGQIAEKEHAIDPVHYSAHTFSDHKNTWGELEPIRSAKMLLRRKQRPRNGQIWSDEGVVPGAVHRLTIDSRIFLRKRKIKGGTVLVDASGSMNLSPEDLSAVVEAAPGAIVAAYAGSSYSGRLVIVAKNGRMASAAEIDSMFVTDECPDGMGGNVVDGPALEWLAKQQEPRIWVSDGIVTGIDDGCAMNLVIEANRICAAADIERIEDWTEVVDALK